MPKHSGNKVQYHFTLKIQGIFRDLQNKKYKFSFIAVYIHMHSDISYYPCACVYSPINIVMYKHIPTYNMHSDHITSVKVRVGGDTGFSLCGG